MVKNTKCCVLGCYNNSTLAETDNTSYFRLPTDKQRANLWLQAIRREPAKRLLVCEHHFDSRSVIQGPTRKRLAAGAVPTRDLPDAAVVEVRSPRWRLGRSLVTHRATQVSAEEERPPPDPPLIDIFVKEETVVGQKRSEDEPDASALLDCPIKREKLDDDAQTDPELMSELDMLIKLSDAHLSPELAKLISVQVSLKREKEAIGDDKICSEELVHLAMKLYHTYPQTYKVMHGALSLPSPGELRRRLRPCEADAGWVSVLRARFSGAAPAQRECVVCVARVALRPALRYDAARDRLRGLHAAAGAQSPHVARTGVLVLARGLHARWRQALACGLLGARADVALRWAWLDRVVGSAFDAGLNVRALVSDFDDDFFPMCRAVSPERPYFTLKEKQIYCFHDCTQLLVKFRDYLVRYDMNFCGLTASWEHLEELHQWNGARAYKLAAELSGLHVRPPAWGAGGAAGAAGGAALAAGALSARVAAALAAAVDLRVLDDSAHGTVQLITFISKLYETLHGKVDHRKNNVTTDVKFLNQSLGLLEKLFLVDKRTGAAVQEPGLPDALRGSTRAALALHQRLRLEGAALPMRAFNNDPLHHFFDRLRALNGDRDPTGPRLLGAFRKSFAFDAMKSLKPTSGGEDLGDFLQAAGEVRGVRREAAAPLPAEWAVPRAVLEGLEFAMFRGQEELERELLERALRRHAGCAAARRWAGARGAPLPAQGCAAARRWAGARGAPLPAELRRLVATLERRFRATLRAERPGSGALLAPLLRAAASDGLAAPCDCFPTLYLKTLFMRFRIYTLVRYNNHIWSINNTKEFALNQLDKNGY